MDAGDIKAICQAGMAAAATRPGRYGGRYVARLGMDHAEALVLLGDDDPEKYDHITDIDIFAQCVPGKVHPVGRARHWLNEDGTLREGA